MAEDAARAALENAHLEVERIKKEIRDKLEQKAENDRKTVEDLVKKDDRAFFEYMLTKDSFIKLILTSKEW